MDIGLENVQDIKSMPKLVNEHKFKSQSQRYFILKSAAKDYTIFEFLTNLQFQIPCPQFYCEFPSNGLRFRKCARHVYAKSSKRA